MHNNPRRQRMVQQRLVRRLSQECLRFLRLANSAVGFTPRVFGPAEDDGQPVRQKLCDDGEGCLRRRKQHTEGAKIENRRRRSL